MTAFVVSGFEVEPAVVMLGAIIGMTYGLLAVGLVLIYRSNRVINFAHGEIGAFGAAIFGLIIRQHVPYYLALAAAVAMGAVTAATAEALVIRRMRNSSNVMSIVATLGIAQFLLIFAVVVNSSTRAGLSLPHPPGFPEFDIGALRVTPAYSAMLILSPMVVVAIAVFLKWSRHGLAIRSAADNPVAARLAGIFAGRMSAASWAVAGMIAVLTTVLLLPAQGLTSGEALGPTTLLRALAAAAIAGMVSLPRALVAGVAIGIAEQLLVWNYPRAGFVEMLIFALVFVALLVQRPVTGRGGERGSWATAKRWRPIAAEHRGLRLVRWFGPLTAFMALAVGAASMLVISNGTAVVLVTVVGFGIIGLSIGLLTGLGGQLSLGQFALAGIGAALSVRVASVTGSFPLAVAVAGAGAGVCAVVIGIPALRSRGLFYTVLTLGLALLTPAWLLRQDWMLGDGTDAGRPAFGSMTFETSRQYYLLALGILSLVMIAVWNLRRSGFARVLVAVRDNESNARAFGIATTWVRVRAFAAAGCLAGIGGAVMGHSVSRIAASSFPAGASLDAVVMSVVGGIGTLAGPLLGAFFVIGVPDLLPLDSAGLAATRLGALLVILYAPGGISQLFLPVRDAVVRYAAARATAETPANAQKRQGRTAASPTLSSTHKRRVPAGLSNVDEVGAPLLEVVGLSKAYGGIRAVDDVSLNVYAGETVGLIGPNGAGKTTLFEMLGGFTEPDSGAIRFAGRAVTRQSAHARSRDGLVRSFQDAALFPTLTVLESVCVALDHRRPSRVSSSVLGMHGADHRKLIRARELVASFGLDEHRDHRVRELSTGTRRFTELACLVALQPRVLLLDEPTAGIAQRETEALASVLRDLREQLDLTLIVIEHDIPLVAQLSDRLIAMDTGRIVCTGAPADVLRDPLVIDAYLGRDVTAIHRSGLAAPVDGHQTALASATTND